MSKYILFIVLIYSLTTCGQTNTNNPQNGLPNTTPLLTKDQKMDTASFWKIMDNAFDKANFNNKLKKQIILHQLIKLTPAQIQEFEIIFQQMNLKANTWNNIAAQTIIEGGASDDTFYYFRCWLISLGRHNFEETLKSPDYLVNIDVPINKKYGYGEVQFEELISLSDEAYSIVTGKQNEDETFPRALAQKKGLFYDSSGETIGEKWVNEDLPKIAPKLYKKYNKN